VERHHSCGPAESVQRVCEQLLDGMFFEQSNISFVSRTWRNPFAGGGHAARQIISNKRYIRLLKKHTVQVLLSLFNVFVNNFWTVCFLSNRIYLLLLIICLAVSVTKDIFDCSKNIPSRSCSQTR
jgi:hypothetical protein